MMLSLAYEMLKYSTPVSSDSMSKMPSLLWAVNTVSHPGNFYVVKLRFSQTTSTGLKCLLLFW